MFDTINLARSCLGSRISCDTVSATSFPPDNLLQEQEWMADTFIRPPVTVTVHLPAPVKLSRLSWTTRVGSQSSSKHEVSVTCDEAALANNHGDKDPQVTFYKVGVGSSVNNVIQFCNRRIVKVNESDNSYRLGSKDKFDALDKVCAVAIKILRTDCNTVPCMKNLQVFGISSGLEKFRDQEASITEKHEIAEQHSNTSSFTYFGGVTCQAEDNADTGAPPNDSLEANKDNDIPQEFLDSITNSLMLLPMTLPSGHDVDRSTLDKCEDMFSSWGGQPRDPFTGKLFSKSHKPIFNAALKARIDRFSLSKKNFIKENQGQTLGNAQMIKKFLDQQKINEERGVKRKYKEVSSLNNQLINQSDDEGNNVEDSTDIDSALSKSLSRVKKILK